MSPCNLLFTNTLLFDGTDQPRRTADVAIAQGRIAAVGDLAGTPTTAGEAA